MKTAFIYADAYLDCDYGPTHPLKIIRLKLSDELPKAYLEKAAKVGFYDKELRVETKFSSNRQNKEIRLEVERIINDLKKTVFPKVRA